MSLISIHEANKDFGIRTLFSNLTLHIKEKDRLGLIGPNGSGKSTLLKVLAGYEPLGSGQRLCSPKVKIELVNQENPLRDNRSVIEEVLAGCGKKRELLLRFKELIDLITIKPNEEKLLTELGQLTQRMDNEKAWNLEQQCEEVLQQLGIKDLKRPIKELSGGYRKRVNLASALVASPDVLLLDEPTNHLDAAAVEWLQHWLDKFPGALVLVTHDRYFLDQITQRIIEIDNGKASNYKGNYTYYLRKKADQDTEEASIAAKLKGVLRRELAWLKQGPKARSTKQKARLKRIKEIRNNSLSGKTQDLIMQSSSRRIGKLVIEAKNISFTADGTTNSYMLLKDFSYGFSPQDRIGIIGPNGSGKSTLLNLLSGKCKPNHGEINIGQTIHFGYLDQHTDLIKIKENLNQKVIEFIEESASIINIKGREISASQLLERFLFTPAQQHSPLNKLSGGERRRLALCKILIERPNLLLLDEPTNDLDIKTLSILEDFLENFQGCIIIVSHDRYFLDRTVDRIFNFENGKIRQFEGNYSTFLQKKYLTDNKKSIPKKSNHNNLNSQQANEILSKDKSTNKFEQKSNKNSKNPRRRSFKESRELEDLDKDLPKLEAKRISIEEAISHESKDLSSLSQELAELIKTIDEAEERWLELSELAP